MLKSVNALDFMVFRQYRASVLTIWAQIGKHVPWDNTPASTLTMVKTGSPLPFTILTYELG